jgi:hypothetical protein
MLVEPGAEMGYWVVATIDLDGRATQDRFTVHVHDLVPPELWA